MGSIDIKPVDLTTALETATANYISSNPKSLSVHKEASRHLPGGNTRTVLHTPPFPLTISSAESCHLTTADGRVLTDFLSEYTAALYGHSHPAIKAALLEAVEKGWNYGAQCGLEGQLAEEICSQERYGKGGMEMCRFVNSGTEANVMALSVASAFTGDQDWQRAGGKGERKKRLGVLMFDKGYHGSVVSGRLDTRETSTSQEAGLVSSTDAATNPKTAAAAPADPQTQQHSTQSPPDAAQAKLSLNLPFDIHVAPYNDEAAVTKLIQSLAPNTLAAILIEPMLGSGGSFSASSSFLSTLRKLADETGALLIFDEVMTSRLGPHGLGYEITKGEVKPDLLSMGKWVGGGSSFGAFGGRRDIMELFNPEKARMEHPGTYNNNVFTMRAGMAGLKVVTSEVLRDLNSRGERLEMKLNESLAAQGLGSGYRKQGKGSLPLGDDGHGLPVRPLSDAEHEDAKVYQAYPRVFVKGVGSILTVHFTGPERAKWQQLFWLHMLEKGYWIAARSFIALNIELTDQHVEGFARAFDEFVTTYADQLPW